MQSITEKLEAKHKKSKVVDVRSGDTVRVHQKIKEGSKERIQVFEGLVIRAKRTGSLTSSITVRRIASGVGVEKSFLLHSPLVQKVEVVKRSDVNRNYLTYMRNRSGKSARLESVDFDREAVNDVSAEEQREKVISDATDDTQTDVATKGEVADVKVEQADDVANEPTAPTDSADEDKPAVQANDSESQTEKA